jgi:hypothetical protein
MVAEVYWGVKGERVGGWEGRRKGAWSSKARVESSKLDKSR